jgi:hypothetical protein
MVTNQRERVLGNGGTSAVERRNQTTVNTVTENTSLCHIDLLDVVTSCVLKRPIDPNTDPSSGCIQPRGVQQF